MRIHVNLHVEGKFMRGGTLKYVEVLSHVEGQSCVGGAHM